MSNLTFTLQQLSYVIAVDTHRHFGRAAKSCHVTQPSLSMQLQKIEDDLGVMLFDRSSQPIEPTDIRRVVIEQARHILAECQTLRELTSSQGKEPTGNLRLGIIPTVSPYLLPLFLDAFLKKYPRVTLDVEEISTVAMLEKLAREELDAGLLSTPVPLGKLTSTVLYHEPFVLCVPAGHGLAERNSVTLKDIDMGEMILLDHSNCFREQVLDICPAVRAGKKGAGDKHPRVKFEAGQLETLKRMVERGHGITLLPDLMVRGDESLKKKNRASIIAFSTATPRREVSIVAGKSWLKKPITEALGEFVKICVPGEYLRFEKGTVAKFSLDKLLP